ncbi:MAG TPA: right-handed parallel beta-helix repeat-containing protein, partial [Thermoflexales bacterium]|nr:right-handed parallel beta-helix repeat-containing protein [Thermoflexales bacterium]
MNTGTLIDATIYFTAPVSQVNLSAPLPALTITGTNVYGPGVRINGAALSTGSMMTINASGAWIYGLRFINGVSRDISVLSGSRSVIEGVFSGAPDDTVNTCLSAGVTRTSPTGIYVGPAVTGDSATPSLWIQDSRINCHALYGIQLDGADGVAIGVDEIDGTPRTNYIGTNANGDALGNDGIGIGLVANGANGAKKNQIRNNWISNSGNHGILLSGTGANTINSTYNNAITGNRIWANGRNSSASGIRLTAGAYSNVIGGSAPADVNRIYGNNGDGIAIIGSELNGVLGNVIGGSPDYPGNNAGNGILIGFESNDNWIGGYLVLFVAIEAGNEIGGNNGDGIRVQDYVRNTAIRRNLIGSDPYGTPRPNGGNGISILNGAYSTTIGTGGLADRNVIAGNILSGIVIDGLETTSNTIRLNDIGINTDAALKGCPCTVAVPNGGYGVEIVLGAHHNQVRDDNYIAHNGRGGILVDSSAHHNQFGPSDKVFANTGAGIQFSYYASWNRVTDMQIYSNTRDGIEQFLEGSNNSWINTAIYQNGGLGIDIATTADDNIPTAGYPVITSVVRAGGVVTVTGTSDSTFSGVSYRTTTVYLFHGGLDPSGYGEGMWPVGSANTNASGVWRIVSTEGPTPRCYAAYKRVVAFDLIFFDSSDASSEFSRSTCGPAYVPMVVR